MENIIDRLVAYIEFRKLNPNKITREAKLSVGLIGKSIQAKKGLHSETIEKFLLTYQEVSADWFVLGKGEMLRKTDEDSESEPIMQSISPAVDELLTVYKTQIEDLKRDKDELKKDKELLSKLLEEKIGKS